MQLGEEIRENCSSERCFGHLWPNIGGGVCGAQGSCGSGVGSRRSAGLLHAWEMIVNSVECVGGRELQVVI